MLLRENLLKQELKNTGMGVMDIYKLPLISKCYGFEEMLKEENINFVVDMNCLITSIFTLLNFPTPLRCNEH